MSDPEDKLLLMLNKGMGMAHEPCLPEKQGCFNKLSLIQNSIFNPQLGRQKNNFLNFKKIKYIYVTLQS
jgi:hypothetical protein